MRTFKQHRVAERMAGTKESTSTQEEYTKPKGISADFLKKVGLQLQQSCAKLVETLLQQPESYHSVRSPLCGPVSSLTCVTFSSEHNEIGGGGMLGWLGMESERMKRKFMGTFFLRQRRQ